jgi:hypothetical protein
MSFLCPVCFIIIEISITPTVLRIRDPNFSILDPGFRVKRQRIPDPDPQQRILLFLTKNYTKLL